MKSNNFDEEVKKLLLGKCFAINQTDRITRVHGGYIFEYVEDDNSHAVFVPFLGFNKKD